MSSGVFEFARTSMQETVDQEFGDYLAYWNDLPLRQATIRPKPRWMPTRLWQRIVRRVVEIEDVMVVLRRELGDQG